MEGLIRSSAILPAPASPLRGERDFLRFLVVGILFFAACAVLALQPRWQGQDAQLGAARPRSTVAASSHAEAPTQPPLTAYGHLPVRFEPNRGQFDPRVKFAARGDRSTLFLTPNEAVLALTPTPTTQFALRMSFLGVAPDSSATPRGVDPLASASNYFLGNDPSRWVRNIPNFAKVKYNGIYPGIGLVFYQNSAVSESNSPGARGLLEYDFNVAPGVDPSQIRLKFAGQTKIDPAANGDLLLKSAAGDLLLKRPTIYQQRPHQSEKIQVPGEYFLAANDEVAFHIGPYDKTQTLIIDPALVYSTFLGGTTSDQVNAIAVDSQGEAFVTGKTSSPDFPVTSGIVQSGLRGPANAFVSKLNAGGSLLLSSTYLGGSSGTGDSGQAIAVDSNGNAYIAGLATSNNFPTVNSVQSSLRSTAGNAFVAELDPNGAGLLYSTYLGGSGTTGDQANGIAVDSTGNAYVVGTTSSTNFPVQAPFQSTLKSSVSNAFVSKITAGGGSLIFSTYLGGSGAQGDLGAAIALGPFDDVLVDGSTSSADFPITSAAFQTALQGASFNAFLTRINSSGASLAYSTYLGGAAAATNAYGLAVDSKPNAYLTGSTLASDFPVTSGVFQPALAGSAGNAFVSKINPVVAGSAGLVYSTYLGGSTATAPGDVGRAIAVDGGGNASVTGVATSSNFPTTGSAFQTTLNSAGGNAFVARFNSTGKAPLTYSTYLGGSNALGDEGFGIAVDSAGAAYVGGRTASSNFPVTSGVPQPQFLAASGGSNGFVAKVLVSSIVSISPASITFGNQYLNIPATAQLVTITNNSSSALTFTSAPSLVGPQVGEFSIASQCGTTLAAGASCTVEVGFTPTAFGNASATLILHDTDPSSPQTVPITGVGYQDFTLAGPTTESVSVGSTVTFDVTVTPLDESKQVIHLTCTGAPMDATCEISPESFQLDGTDVVTSTVTIITHNALPPFSRRGPHAPWQSPYAPLVIAVIGALTALAMIRGRKQHPVFALGVVSAVLAVCLIFAGCGSGAGTPQGVTTLVITGVASPGGQNHTLAVALTVN